MSKSVIEIWVEVVKKSIVENYILEYYLSSKTKTRVYFGLIDAVKVIYLEFSKNALNACEALELKGLDISIQDVSVISPEKRYIVIKNVLGNDEIFLAFSSSLCDALLDIDSYFEAFNALKAVIKEYKDYFSNPNKTLSQQEEQGLCAELLQLEYLVKKFGEKVVINWQGPKRNKRDFVFEQTALEVKSTMAQTNTNILISNENQLDCNYPDKLKHLYLKFFIFELIDNGFTLIDCANKLLELVEDVNFKTMIVANLLKLKVNINTYKPVCKFAVQGTRFYEITNQFPKITKDMLSCEIFDVKYRLKLDALRTFETNEEDLIYE